MAMVAKNTHAAGQCSVPAGTNSSAPIAAIQIKFCSNSFAIMGEFPFSFGPSMMAVFFGELAAVTVRRRTSS
jgi:hypothetical protein